MFMLIVPRPKVWFEFDPPAIGGFQIPSIGPFLIFLQCQQQPSVAHWQWVNKLTALSPTGPCTGMTDYDLSRVDMFTCTFKVHFCRSNTISFFFNARKTDYCI